jgi:phosphatidylglycerophosphatase A
MTASADSQSSDTPSAAATAQATPARKPRVALFIATAAGLGYIPKAPGTFGSLAGLLLAMFPFFVTIVITWIAGSFFISYSAGIDPVLIVQIFLTLGTACVGVWAANRAAKFWREKDPQRVVIDEVSGQHLALLLGLAAPVWWRVEPEAWGYPLGLITLHSALNWKYLLLGLILFRVFDIWKPFPASQAESLPGGWGIMADDWVAGVYAAIGLWIARAVGL